MLNKALHEQHKSHSVTSKIADVVFEAATFTYHVPGVSACSAAGAACWM
jgi:hypothetical protein